MGPRVQQPPQESVCHRRQATPGLGTVLRLARGLPEEEVLVERVGLGQGLVPGEVASEKAEQEDAQRPGIQGRLDGQALGEGWGTAELGGRVGDGRPRQAQQGPSGPCVAEVGQLDVPAGRVAHQHVLWLEVPVHQAVGVNVLQGRGQLGCAALGCRLREAHLRGTASCLERPVPRRPRKAQGDEGPLIGGLANLSRVCGVSGLHRDLMTLQDPGLREAWWGPVRWE